jgi:Methylamine utilisation protein MauE
VDAVVYLARATLAWVFVLSATWKSRNPGKFRVAFRSSVPPRLKGFDAAAVRVVPTVELLCAAALFVPGRAGQTAALAALALLVLFTWSLNHMRDLAAGCGCWPSPVRLEPSRTVLLIRNLTLLAIGGLAAVRASLPPIPQVLFAFASGSLVAMLVMEMPLVATIGLAQRKEESSA